ncbi:MAG: hypothetical protein WD942_07255 [Dehalococcoidia bacterium]
MARLKLTYRTGNGHLGNRLLFREHEEELELVEPGRTPEADREMADAPDLATAV